MPVEPLQAGPAQALDPGPAVVGLTQTDGEDQNRQGFRPRFQLRNLAVGLLRAEASGPCPAGTAWPGRVLLKAGPENARCSPRTVPPCPGRVQAAAWGSTRRAGRRSKRGGRPGSRAPPGVRYTKQQWAPPVCPSTTASGRPSPSASGALSSRHGSSRRKKSGSSGSLKRCRPSVTARPEASRTTSHFTGEAVRSRRPVGWQATASATKGTSHQRVIPVRTAGPRCWGTGAARSPPPPRPG